MRRNHQHFPFRVASLTAYIRPRLSFSSHQLVTHRLLQTVTASSTARQNSLNPPRDLLQTPTGSLIRAYIVYSTLSFPYFIDIAPTVLKVATSIPIIKQIALFVIRNTFFKHFVGGDTSQDTVPLINRLRERNLGCLLGYSVEVDEEEAKHATTHDMKHQDGKVPEHEKKLQETMSSISFAGNLEDGQSLDNAGDRRTYVAVKLVRITSIIMFDV